MEKDKKEYRILVVEDNLGDFVLVEEYLDDHILDPYIVNAQSFRDADTILKEVSNNFDVILLDLSLPDRKGEVLVLDMLKISRDIPVIILTGYTDMPFSIRSMQLGISDYLVKDILTPLSLYKSILHNIDRKKFIVALEHSKKRYNDLFHLSPQPMMVYDEQTLMFLDVNDSALKDYGYSMEEFLNMSIYDLRPEEDVQGLMEYLQQVNKKESPYRRRNGRHRLKNGEIIEVEVHSNSLVLNNRDARVVLSNNITEKALYIRAIEEQNEKLKEIAWIQSHIVRAPLARLMGIAEMLKDNFKKGDKEQLFFLDEILNSANELDNVIKDINTKSSEFDLNKK